MKKFIAPIVAIILLILAVATYYGRIYYPQNFHPETISFFENYIVMLMGISFFAMIVAILLLMMIEITKQTFK